LMPHARSSPSPARSARPTWWGGSRPERSGPAAVHRMGQWGILRVSSARTLH
jgi:hypothetical protein